jgi:hypothetical protein
VKPFRPVEIRLACRREPYALLPPSTTVKEFFLDILLVVRGVLPCSRPLTEASRMLFDDSGFLPDTDRAPAVIFLSTLA